MQRKVIILTDGKAGHENQSKAFARALGCDFDLVGIRFKSAFHKALSYLLDHIGIHTLSLFANHKTQNTDHGYAAVIGTGSGTFYAAKALARKLGVRCGVVLYPRGYRISSFDCILAPAFDRPPKTPNVIEIPANLVANDEAFYAAGVEAFRARHTLSGKSAVAVIVGGPNKCSTMSADWMRTQLEQIFAAHKTTDHEIWVTTSRRTPQEVEAVVDSFPFDYKLLYSKDHFNPIPAFVKLAKTMYVTAESTGMLSESCTFGTAEVRVLDNLNPGPHKFRRFVEDLRHGGYVDGANKVDLSGQFARAKDILFKTTPRNGKAAMLIATVAASFIAFAAEPVSVQTAPRVRIVAETFPIYDWTRQILGSRLAETDLTLLQQGGVDLHGYSPSAADLRKIASCDLFMFVGGDSDSWAERSLALSGNPNRRVLSLVKTLGHKPHKHDADGHDAHQTDEHVWLSLRHASTLVMAIAADLATLDPANAAAYRANATAYCERLASLDRAYAEAVAKAKRRTILVADRFPFCHLTEDYGISYHAAFSGCSAESEASFKTVARLAKKVDELELPAILVIEGTKHRLAETVRRTTKSRDQRILTLNSLQSIGGEAVKTTRYLDVMAQNLETLKSALN